MAEPGGAGRHADGARPAGAKPDPGPTAPITAGVLAADRDEDTADRQSGPVRPRGDEHPQLRAPPGDEARGRHAYLEPRARLDGARRRSRRTVDRAAVDTGLDRAGGAVPAEPDL